MVDTLDLVQVSDEERLPSELLIDWEALTRNVRDEWADWMPFLVFGVPQVQIARIFDIDKSTITHALHGNKDFARRVAQGRKMVKRQLHYVWLDQKAVAAWRNIDYYLAVDPFEKNEDGQYIHNATMRRAMFQEKAKMTRFVLQQLGLHVQRYEVTHTTPQPMFLGDETLAQYVVERVKDVMTGEEERDVETIAAKYRFITGVGDDDIEDMVLTEEEEETERPYDRKSDASKFA